MSEVVLGRFNNGLIYTNDKCIACNKCIHQCSILGANVSILRDNKTHVEIDSRKCNDCGKCIALCSNHAREYRDDSVEFLKALESGEKLSVILAPTFYLLYKDEAEKIIGYLKSIGVDKVYDGGFGAEISIWATVNYLYEAKKKPSTERAFILNTCPSLVNVIEKYHPFLLQKIIPVQTPLMCTAIYAHKYLGDKNKIAFIGPCIAKKDEISCEFNSGNVKYNVTFDNLMQRLKGLKLEQFKGKPDLIARDFGRIVPKNGTLKQIISYFFSRNETTSSMIGFSKENFDKLYMSISPEFAESQPLITEVLACKGGCITGPGNEKGVQSSKYIFSTYKQYKDKAWEKYESISNPEKLFELLNQQYKDLILADFNRTYTNRARQPFHIPESNYNEIFNDMLKDTEEKRNLNCGSCGHSSCREMAKSIAHGYNRKENCIHYMNDLVMSNFLIDKETGVYSNAAFTKYVAELFNNNPDKTYIIVVGDVNKLKIINDLYGYDVGTSVLKMIAAILKQTIGDNKYICRLSGGMFAICLENTVEQLQRIQGLKIFDCSSIGITFPVTMRFGLYMTSEEDNVNEALTKATLCMDTKVSSIQNTFNVFTNDFREKTVKEAEITSQMQSALDNGEFHMWFQPQYSANTGELVGAEALCRWIKEDGTMISPGLFIPIAEKNGFIRKLDKEIWRMVFEKVKKWLDSGIQPVPISVNISRVSLESDSMYYVIKRLKEEYEIPENYIHFEVTESAYVGEQGEMARKIAQIRELGYKIAMDDFGSGYSSLNTLKDLPIDILKLDLGFIHGESNMEKGGAIISCISKLAQDLEYVTVAEGVETEEQADFLRSVGVNIIQGFLYSRPMSEENFQKEMQLHKKTVITKNEKKLEELDVQKFYDPSSTESIMFEQYSGPAMICEYEIDSKTLSVVKTNKSLLNLIGMSDMPIVTVKKHIMSCMEKKKAEDDDAGFMDDISFSSKTFEYKTEILNYKTQTPIYLKISGRIMGTTYKKIVLYELCEDITNEKLAETTFNLSNSQTELIMENSQVGMCLMNVKVDLLHFQETVKVKILKVNQTFINASGFEKEDILSWDSKKALSVIHPSDRLGFITQVTKMLLSRTRNTFSYIYRAKRRDGSYVKTQIFLTCIQQPDKSYMVITNYTVLDE